MAGHLAAMQVMTGQLLKIPLWLDETLHNHTVSKCALRNEQCTCHTSYDRLKVQKLRKV